MCWGAGVSVGVGGGEGEGEGGEDGEGGEGGGEAVHHRRAEITGERERENIELATIK